MLGGLGYFLMIALQFGVVIAFSARLTERSVGTTRMLFLAYALITAGGMGQCGDPWLHGPRIPRLDAVWRTAGRNAF